MDPFKIEVRYVARQAKAMDSLTLLQNEYKLEVMTGGGKKEEVNCILPLFTFKDKDLRPLLQHNLYHLLMTFNIVQNVDTLYD